MDAVTSLAVVAGMTLHHAGVSDQDVAFLSGREKWAGGPAFRPATGTAGGVTSCRPTGGPAARPT